MYEYKAIVDRVVDGDTVDFIVDLGFSVKIKIRGRLSGVDTPERGHEDWAKATSVCKDLLQKVGTTDEITGDTSLVIKTGKTGKYGRWIVEIQGVTDELAKIWPYKTRG
tara:strand:+ start:5428 stop:5754 length:327 start_codon:yes stop_codon:yes gene_type:complete